MTLGYRSDKEFNERIKKAAKMRKHCKSSWSCKGTQLEVRKPRVDIYESDNSYLFRLSIPGVQKEDIKLFFSSHNKLEIEGVVRPKIPEKFRETLLKEIYQGPFRRQLEIPQYVDNNNINFTYTGGILEITLLKMTQK